MTDHTAPRQLLTPDNRPVRVQLRAAFRQPWAIGLVGAIAGSWMTLAAVMLGFR